MRALAAWRDALLEPADLDGLAGRGRRLAQMSLAALGVAIVLFGWRTALWLPPVASNTGFDMILAPPASHGLVDQLNIAVTDGTWTFENPVFSVLSLVFSIATLVGPVMAAICLFKGWRLWLTGIMTILLVLHLGSNTMKFHVGEANIKPRAAARLIAGAKPSTAAERAGIAVVAAELAYIQGDPPAVARNLRAIGPVLPRTDGTEWRIGIMQDWAEAHGQSVRRDQHDWLLVMPTWAKRAMRTSALILGVGGLMMAAGCAGLSLTIRRRVSRVRRRFPGGDVALLSPQASLDLAQRPAE